MRASRDSRQPSRHMVLAPDIVRVFPMAILGVSLVGRCADDRIDVVPRTGASAAPSPPGDTSSACPLEVVLVRRDQALPAVDAGGASLTAAAGPSTFSVSLTSDGTRWTVCSARPVGEGLAHDVDQLMLSFGDQISCARGPLMRWSSLHRCAEGPP